VGFLLFSNKIVVFIFASDPISALLQLFTPIKKQFEFETLDLI